MAILALPRIAFARTTSFTEILVVRASTLSDMVVDKMVVESAKIRLMSNTYYM